MKNLLLRVDAVVSKYKEVEKITGENFNIFSIMGMKTDEVRTHSAILAELLSPNGSHGLGTEPLELFVKQIYSEEIGLDYKTATCSKEFYAGKINEDYTEGGRIDLLIKDKEETKMVIENKINAPEQKNQLFRYKQRFPNAKLLFLTLDGKESKENGIEYQPISYKDDILNWIEDCAKLAWNKPMVREVLVHYAHLIKILTNQTINNKMSEEIINIILSDFKASAEIYKNFEKALELKQLEYLNELNVKLLEQFKDELCEKTSSNFKIEIGETLDTDALLIHCGENITISYRFKHRKHPVTRIEFKGTSNFENLESEIIGFKRKVDKDKDEVIYWKMENNRFNLDYFNEDHKANKQDEIVNSLLFILGILENKIDA